MNFSEVRDRLAAALVAAEMSQRQFALRAGISPSFVTDVMKLRSKPSLELVVGVVEVLDCSATWLLCGHGEMRRRPSAAAPLSDLHVLADRAALRSGRASVVGVLEALAGDQLSGVRSA